MYKVFYEEEQKFNNKAIWLLLSGLSIVFFYILFEQLFLDKTIGTNRAPNSFLIFMGLIPLAGIFLFSKTKLKTRIDTDGIHFQYFPFHKTERHLKWDEISEFYVRKYNPIMEYGGWGIRIVFSKRNIAYNVSGNRGLQIVLTNNRKILLGTQNHEHLQYITTQLKVKFKPS